MEDKKITKDANNTTTQAIIDDEVQLVGNNENPTICAENPIKEGHQNDPVLVDFENKIGIVYHVLKACIREQSESVHYYRDFIVSRLEYLTNLPRHVLTEIINKAKEPKKADTLEDSLLDTSDIDFLIRRTLVNYYVRMKKIPRKDSLAQVTQNHCYNYELHHQLKRSGYIWRRLPNSKRAIIVEHPKRLLQRQRYLQKITSYRKDHRRILYIETRTLNRADKDICHFQQYLNEAVNFIVIFVAVINDSRGFLNGHIFASKSIYVCQKVIEDYIIKSIIPSLTEPSVIILEDKPYYAKSLPVPTIESEKSEMTKWLKINGIPHEENIHRSELFELIQRCKGKNDLHNFDAVLYGHGHEILRRPARTEYLNYYKSLWANISSTEDVTISISRKNPEYWKNLEISLIRIEKCVLHEDLEMENITDKILTMANNVDVNEWADAECDAEEDSLTQEEYIIETSNSFSQQELQIREWQLISEVKKFERILNQN